MTDEDFIMTSADDAWETLREGESLLVKGKLEAVLRRKSVIISFPSDWSRASLELEKYNPLHAIPLSSDVTVRAIRTEDGMRAIAVWTPNGVPIPC